jgi:RimJ/RimL family protein N-acetyltransferase
MRIRLVKYNLDFLNKSLSWLNDDEIRKLTDTPTITKEIQEVWFNNLKEKKDYLIWGIEFELLPIGACGLKNITNSDCEYWGYIGEKQFWGKGLGKEMMDLAEEKARELGKSSLRLKVIKENTRAISLYKKQGYFIKSETKSLYEMRKLL